MTRFAVLLPLLLAVTACGGVDFAGSYEGPITFKMNCPGIEAIESTETNTMTIVDTSDGIAFTNFGGGCPNIPATVNDNGATIVKTTCEPQTDAEGVTTTITMSGGTLTLNGTGLTVSMIASVLYAGPGGTLTCPASFAGSLVKQE